MAKFDVRFTGSGQEVPGVDEAELKQMLREGHLSPDDYVRRQGDARWRIVAELRGRSATAAATAVAPTPMGGEFLTADAPRAVSHGSTAALLISEGHHAVDGAHDDHDGGAFKAKRLEVEPLDMTPMVDVVLLLLMFFMVTSAYSMQKAIETPAPNPDKQQQVTQKPPDLKEIIRVNVTAENRIFIEDELTPVKELVERFRTISAETQKNKVVVVLSGESTNETWVRIYNAATEAGVGGSGILRKVSDKD